MRGKVIMKPKADRTHWTLVFDDNKLRHYATQAEAEAEFRRMVAYGVRAYIIPPPSAWGGKGPPWWRKAVAESES